MGRESFTTKTYAFESAPGVGMSPRDKAVMVRKFCTGSLDKDAGLHAANQQPKPLNGAIRHILRSKLNRRDVYSKTNVNSTVTLIHRRWTGVRTCLQDINLQVEG